MAERGQATVEWVGLVLLACLAFGALVAVAPHIDGRSFGGFLAHRVVCAVKGHCHDGDAELARAYGPEDAALVRRLAPSLVYEPGEPELPVDWRHCRARSCADAPDDRDLDAHRSQGGARATVFTRLQRRGGQTFVSYFLYYPDSNSTWAASDKLWEASWLLPRLRELVAGTSAYPGFHLDDWENAEVRLDADGKTWIRASAHGGYDTCKDACRERDWIEHSGWTRVSRGSHAGHMPTDVGGRHPRFPGADTRERTSTAEGLRLIPLETVDQESYRPLDPGISPPWRKRVYRHPTDGGS
jgi:hypothetical protein